MRLFTAPLDASILHVNVHPDVVHIAPVSTNIVPASSVAGEVQLSERVEPSRNVTEVVAKLKEKYVKNIPVIRVTGTRIFSVGNFIGFFMKNK